MLKLALKIIIYTGCWVVLDGNNWPHRKWACSIKEFFSTSEPIWTHTTTGKTNLRCLVDQVNEMKQQFIIYTRSCYNKEYKVSRILYGTFYEHRRKHMDVKPKGKGVSFQEDLLYVSGDKSCAVIMVTTNVGAKRVTYDVRVRNSHIRWPPHHKCLHVYEKFEMHGQVLYDPSCQGILAKSANLKV
nr:uncharacterized protein LOC119185995 [Rhipicephalus microplus]